MQKLNVLSKLTDCGVVVVVRADTEEIAERISEACIEGGIFGIEVAFTTQGADAVIKKLVTKYAEQKEVVIGAGTVLDAVTARIAILAGAQYIVSPSFDEETAKLCNLYQIPYMPGCMTITEIKNAMTFGVDIVKLFPGNTLGIDFIKAVKAPLPHVNIMPTGGVDLNNVGKWIQSGCVAVGVGGSLVAPAKTGDYAEITRLSKEYVEKVREARGTI